MLTALNIDRSGNSCPAQPTPSLFSPELYFLSKLPAEIDIGETAPVVITGADALLPQRRPLSILACCRLDPVRSAAVRK